MKKEILETETLEKLHHTLQEILDEVVAICESNGIKYYLFYGTLLGAERHKGFIPWDDDLDIIMPRDDYERFLTIAEKGLSNPYHLHHIGNDPNYINMFAKVKKRGTIFRERWMSENYKYQEVFIDIFPLDYATKSNSIWHHIRKRLYFILSMSIRRKHTNWNMTSIKGVLNKIFTSFIPASLIYKAAKHIACFENKNKGCKYYIDFNDILKITWKMEQFDPAKKIQFEGKLYNAPIDSQTLLKDIYNDWEVIPPKEKQITHAPLELHC